MGYFKQGALIEQTQTIATAAGTTTLTASSKTNTQFTGTSTQTVVLPDATTLPVGRKFRISNRSTGLVTVNYNGGSLAALIVADFQREFILINAGTSAGVWDVSTGDGTSGGGGGGSSGTEFIDNGGAETDTSGWALFYNPFSEETIQDLTYYSKILGTAGDAINLTYVDPAGAGFPLSVSVVGNDIEVSLETDIGSVIVSTATDIASAINLDADASALVIATISGTGGTVQTAQAQTFLAGGVDLTGTGGAPSANFTLTRTTTNPLDSTGSFLITKAATLERGRGVSYDFSIERGDRGGGVDTSFLYEKVSGGFNGGVSSDIRVYLYDVTNSNLVEISPDYIKSSTFSQYSGFFDSTATSSSYRLILFHYPYNTSAWAWKFDRVSASPSSVDSNEFVGASYERTTSQSVTNNVDTIIDFDTQVYDSHGAVTTGAAWVFTAPVSGKYRVSSTMLFANSAVGIRYCFFRKNGAGIEKIGDTDGNPSVSIVSTMTPNGTIFLDVGDTLQLLAYQSSGGSLNTDASFLGGISISIEKIGD